MKEKKIKINTNDDHIIYGTLNSLDEKSSTLLIFVHGITGNQNEHHYFNAVPYFTQKGIDTFRFDFYTRKPKSRQLGDSSIGSHVDDLKFVIDRYRDVYDDLILVGHSLGAIVILNSDLSDIARIVLWDPTTGFDKVEDKGGYFEPKLDKFIINWGMNIIIGKQMIEEWKSVDLEQLIKNITIPVKFVFAGDDTKYDIWKPYLKNIEVQNEIAVVDGATHCFNEPGTEEELFEETMEWVG